MQNIVTIRPINNDYCPQVIDIVLTIQQVEFSLPITIEDQPDLRDIEANYHQGGGNFWGAFLDDELIGTIALINGGQGLGAIRKMFVKQAYRGKALSVAQQLLNTLLQYSGDNNFTDFYLGTVPPLKAAHRFYERNGFLSTRADDLPLHFPRMAADSMFYRLHLNK
ncbi:GNAT family N-acetyltransferase [Mucilaginibacter antarcticus]|uniref:GNAT family N-acetyltransferase n=1 Tax=Mucilaginibacter antarcticus TaxID=1855725 RepID=A0ABW5XMW4_9SPHI